MSLFWLLSFPISSFAISLILPFQIQRYRFLPPFPFSPFCIDLTTIAHSYKQDNHSVREIPRSPQKTGKGNIFSFETVSDSALFRYRQGPVTDDDSVLERTRCGFENLQE